MFAVFRRTIVTDTNASLNGDPGVKLSPDFPRIKVYFKDEYPSWRCQKCGEQLGYLGRFMEYFFGWMVGRHKCVGEIGLKPKILWWK
jgi:hypothetical protein